ncbi:MAG: hypothetical protein KF756_08280 [Acidobacteria bacterium]|nr:hypothetical protein [Acidobacteriota bacterium]
MKNTFCVILIFGSLWFTVNGQTVGHSEPALVVNGMPVDNGVRTIGGRTYVDLDAIAKSLNIVVKKSTGVIVLDSGCTSGATSSVVATSVSGSLSYYFNRNYGNKPDVGSKVYLIQSNDKPLFQGTDTIFVVGDKLIVTRTKEDRSEFKVLYSTAADGNGRYEFKGIEPGSYWLLAVSAHANGESNSQILGKTLTKSIDINRGQSLDVSYDFGMTYF